MSHGGREANSEVVGPSIGRARAGIIFRDSGALLGGAKETDRKWNVTSVIQLRLQRGGRRAAAVALAVGGGRRRARGQGVAGGDLVVSSGLVLSCNRARPFA